MTQHTAQQLLRCAIYTRKSHADGLEQDFNSIDAQKEAAHHYIKLQAVNGWMAVPTEYDDPAFSGGNMDRPALQRLMDDVERGCIDIVIVYKIDRFSRSLLDFSQLMHKLNQHNVSFVSVTQDFNTHNSMGRLMLNILFSFAQFEREVTAERIRDKIAASKRKGLWMGGVPPLGYDVEKRQLVINEREASLVRHIFQRFTQIKSATLLTKELADMGATTKTWTTQNGAYHAGKPIRKGFIYKLLKNQVYLGMISHKQDWYLGKHTAIINQETWDNVQTIFAQQSRGKRHYKKTKVPFLLQGLIFDHNGYALITWSTTKKQGKRYRYYVSSQDANNYAGASSLPRFQANELEQTVLLHLRKLLRAPEIIQTMGDYLPAMDEAQITVAMLKIEAIWDQLFPEEQCQIVKQLVKRIIVSTETIEIQFHQNGIEALALSMHPQQTAGINV